jgi:hypothetical protein
VVRYFEFIVDKTEKFEFFIYAQNSFSLTHHSSPYSMASNFPLAADSKPNLIHSKATAKRESTKSNVQLSCNAPARAVA